MRNSQALDANGFANVIPFISDLNARCVSATGGQAEVRLQLQPRHLNSLDMAHGGVTMAMLDVSMAVAAGCAPERDGAPTAGTTITIEMKTTFMQPGRGELIARSVCIHRTRSMAFCEGEIRDAANTLVARGNGTFKYVRPRNQE